MRWRKSEVRKRWAGDKLKEVTPLFPRDNQQKIILCDPIPHLQKVDLILPKYSLGKVQIQEVFSNLIRKPLNLTYVSAGSKDPEVIRPALEQLECKTQDKSPI